jgi:hypothetical protein
MIQAGDTVECRVGYYKSYSFGERAIVKRTDITSAGNLVIILPNYLADCGESMYSICNWTKVEPKKEKDMTHYKKTKYFAIKVDTVVSTVEQLEFDRPMTRTKMRDSRSQVVKDIAELTQEGEAWIVLQTVCMVEPKKPELPKVPVTIVEEYR